MKRIHLLFYLGLFILASCSKNKNQITLSFTNIEGEVATHGNFLFTFNQVIAPDSVQFSWDDAKYLKFSPAIEGQYRWVGANELSFSPNEPLLPATNYTASFTNKLLDVNSTFKSMDIDDMEFHTPNLRIESSNLFWYLDDNGSTSALMQTRFNYNILPKEVAKLIELSNNDEQVNLSLLEDGESYFASFDLSNLELVDEDQEFKLRLKKGLKPIGGSIGIEEDFEELLVLKSPFKIEITETETEHDGVNGDVILHTSQGIQKEKVKDFIELSPSVKFTVNVEGNKLIIRSSGFDVKTKYSVKVKQGLNGMVGGTLKADYLTEVSFGELEPSIEFENSKGMYLSAAGNQNVAIRIVNIEEVKVSLYKLYENNILSSDLGNNYYYDDYYYNDYYYGELQEQDLLWEKKFKTEKLSKVGSSSLLNLDFKDELNAYNGIYFVKVQSTEDYWLNDAKYISKSDLGIIAKKGQNKISVFVNSLKTTESLSGVDVKVFGRNNQLVAEGLSSSDGSVNLSLKNSNFSGFEPALITASKNGDFSILNMHDGRVETSRFDVGGYRDLPNGLQTFIYLERNIYRPGEIINFASIIRNQSWVSPGTLPIRIEILNPMGKRLKTIKKSLNDEGSLASNFTVAADAVTGLYSIYLYTSNDVLLASKNVMVEEFMPDRIKVKTSLSSKELTVKNNESILKIQAQNLFGPPASNRDYQVEVSYRRKYFSPKEFNDYSFNIRNTDSYFDVDYWEGKTADNGEVVESITMHEYFRNMGVIQASILTTVFDETGRPVNRKNTLDIYTQDLFYGIGDFNYYIATNTAMKVPLVVVDKEGKAKSGVDAKIQVIKHEYQTVLNKSGSYYRYESNKVEKKLIDKTISLNGEAIFNYTPTISGEYEIRVYNPDVNGKYVSQYFYAYGYGRTYLSSFEVDNEGRIDIEMDKESYHVGDKAKVLFKTPFQGKMLVTVEGKDVLQHFYVNTDKRSAEISINMEEAFLPNVYVTATLFKPHEATEFPLTVAHGFQSIKVEDDRRHTKMSIESADESRSNISQKITVKGAPNAMVSIAVVDEGILQVGGFNTPKPYDYFYQRRALQVSSADIYPFLLPEISSSNSSGGDDGFDMSKRVNPFQNKRVKLVSYWSGLIKTNAFGEASFDIDIPQFSGSLRVMAVGHKGKAFGSVDKQIIVADPIVISSSIPRFLSPGDTAYIASTLTNTTKNSASAKSSISVSGPLKVVGSSKENVSIGGKAENRIVYKVYAEQALGNGMISVSCTAFGETFTEETAIAVRPSSPLIKQTESGSLSAGNSVKLNGGHGKFLKETADYKLLISKNPMVEFADDLDYLVRYPYGCSEQTVSAVFPQLYYKDLVSALYNKDDQSENIVQNIAAAMNKLKMRQLYNGAVTMWDACGDCENWWVTAYTAHFLVEAKEAGFNVDEEFLNTMLGYLKNKLKSKKTIDYYYKRSLSKKIAPKEVPYSLYVLALADKADVSLMNYYKTNTSLLSMDGQYLLAAAYVLAGDKEKGKSLLPNSFENEDANRQFGGSFYSPVRDEAIALNALLTVDPNHKDVGVMAKHISEYLRNKKYYLNTQDRIFSFLALGKIAKLANESDVSASVKADGKVIGNYTSGVLELGSADLADKKIELVAEGKGNVFYYFEAEGITKDGSYTEEDNHLKVRKTFYDRYGNLIRGNSFEQNDLIVIKLSITADYSRVENVVITDMLPAGFEIENPRIDDVPGVQWIKNKSYPDYMDIRDDRINFFDDVYVSNGKTQDYYYVVRAVSPGKYKMGPVGADAMYNGEYHSYHGAGWIEIKE